MALTSSGRTPGQSPGIGYTYPSRLVAGKEWEKALDKCAEGLKQYPKHDRLANNAIATADDWARGAMKQEKWEEAFRIYEQG